jgi:hypothetical protein
MNKYKILLVSTFLILLIGQSANLLAHQISDELELHGFFTQHAIHTSDNNMYGKSDDSVSWDFTEAAVNLYYAPFEKLSFSFQGLYRNAGEVDKDSFDTDYLFSDIMLNHYAQGNYGVRLGRVKNPLGLFNETRDVAFTTPSIILPQGIYYDRSRSLFLSSDGMQLYWQHLMPSGDLSVKLNLGKNRNDNDELLKAVIPYPTSIIPFSPQGDLETSASHIGQMGQIVYEHNGGEMIYALSYANVSLFYKPAANDLFTDGETDFELYILSAQYNGEKFSLIGEYLYQNNNFTDFGPLYPDASSKTTSWYAQLNYRFMPKWQVYGRYAENFLNKDDRNGSNNDLIGAPRHIAFSKSSMLGIRWDINASMMLRAEYHYIDGTSWLTSADNPDQSLTRQYWDMLALQFSLRF